MSDQEPVRITLTREQFKDAYTAIFIARGLVQGDPVQSARLGDLLTVLRTQSSKGAGAEDASTPKPDRCTSEQWRNMAQRRDSEGDWEECSAVYRPDGSIHHYEWHPLLEETWEGQG